uniref:TcC31.7 n=1 Tax=Trypanosoma cruzi TaxID=5693 RepID=O61095_TRYCR|nr:TcC31.7 [Trypanosoma cruzi]
MTFFFFFFCCFFFFFHMFLASYYIYIYIYIRDAYIHAYSSKSRWGRKRGTKGKNEKKLRCFFLSFFLFLPSMCVHFARKQKEKKRKEKKKKKKKKGRSFDPLKTQEEPKLIPSPPETFNIYPAIYIYIYKYDQLVVRFYIDTEIEKKRQRRKKKKKKKQSEAEGGGGGGGEGNWKEKKKKVRAWGTMERCGPICGGSSFFFFPLHFSCKLHSTKRRNFFFFSPLPLPALPSRFTCRRLPTTWHGDTHACEKKRR